jgi:hypothetical protein
MDHQSNPIGRCVGWVAVVLLRQQRRTHQYGKVWQLLRRRRSLPALEIGDELVLVLAFGEETEG